MSTRDITSLNIGALNAAVVRPILFVRMDFDLGVQRFHTEIGPRTIVHPTHGSESYTGLGDFGGINGELVETISNAPPQVRLALSGINSTLMTEALGEDYHRRDVDLLFGFDDENGDLIDDPVLLTSLFMDKVEINLSAGKKDIVMVCDTRASILQGTSDLRFTDEQLQSDYTGDLAGEYIYRMLDIVLKVGGKTVSATGGGGSRWAPPRTPNLR